jgi:LEA14-like dessication related protein
MRAKPFLFALLVLLLMGSGGCKIYQDVEVKEVTNVALKEMNTSGLTADVYMTLENPNWYKLTLIESDIDIFLEGKKVGNLALTQPLVIPKKSRSTQVMTVNTSLSNMDQVLGSVFTLMFKEEFELSGKGYITGKGMFVRKKVDVQFKETIPKSQLGF